MAPLDTGIIVAYLLVLLGKSALLARRAGRGGDEYFLAGRKMPWWALGAWGMSSNLDAAGTMTILALVHTYGLHGFFIEMREGMSQRAACRVFGVARMTVAAWLKKSPELARAQDHARRGAGRGRPRAR